MNRRISFLLFLSSLTAACGQIGSYAAVVPAPKPYRLQPGELLLAAVEEDIPPLHADESHFVPAEKAGLEEKDLVVGLFIGGESRAYPVRLLSLREVVNDRVGGIAIAVTWCPLCYSPVVFDRTVDGQELTFRASGYLLNDNLVLADHPTDTLWSQLLGQGIKGALKGSMLEVYPSTITTWSSWQKAYPDSSVLSAERAGYVGELPDPYGGYFSTGAAGLGGGGELDPRLPAKTLVIGLVVGGEEKAYPLNEIQQEKSIQDQIGDLSLNIVWDDSLQAVQIFGGSNSGVMTPIPSQLVYWFAWTAFFPDTAVYLSP